MLANARATALPSDGHPASIKSGLPLRSAEGSPSWSGIDPVVYHGGVITQRYRRTWSHVSATLDYVEAEHSMKVEIDSTSARISVVLEVVGGKFVVDAAGNSGPESDLERFNEGPVSILPKSFRAGGTSERVRFLRHLLVQVDESRLQDVYDEVTGSSGKLIPKLMFLDQRLMDLSKLIAHECQSSLSDDSLFGDTLASAMMIALARSHRQKPRSLARGGMAPFQLQKVQRHMLDNIAKTAALSELAEIVTMSVAHFCRAFKISTGKAPHQWLIEARIETAKSLLLRKEMSLAHVALTLGFCDQAHFTRTFSKIVGTTPLAWIRDKALAAHGVDAPYDYEFSG